MFLIVHKLRFCHEMILLHKTTDQCNTRLENVIHNESLDNTDNQKIQDNNVHDSIKK